MYPGIMSINDQAETKKFRTRQHKYAKNHGRILNEYIVGLAAYNKLEGCVAAHYITHKSRTLPVGYLPERHP
jgi:hypothetical protein